MYLRLLPYLAVVGLAIFLLGASDKPAEVKSGTSKKSATENHQSSSKNIETHTNQKSENSTPLLTEILKTLSAIENYQKAAYEQARADQESWWPNSRIQFGILLVGALYAVFASLQWLAIRRQVNLERPWMMFRPENPNSGSFPPGQGTPANMWPLPLIFNSNQRLFNVPWNIINVGRSPAFLTRLVATLEVVPTGNVPPTPLHGSSFPNYIISPKTPPDDRFGSNLPRYLIQSEFNDVQNGSARIWVYGVVEYHGIRKHTHTTRFCCVWYVENGNSVYDPVGPEGWTGYT